jgi:hypothetical protein
MREGEGRRACDEREEIVCGALAHTPRYASSEFFRECALAAPGDAYHPNDFQRCHDGEEVWPAGRVAAIVASENNLGRKWMVGGGGGGEGRRERKRRCQSEAGAVGNAGNHAEMHIANGLMAISTQICMQTASKSRHDERSPDLTQHTVIES